MKDAFTQLVNCGEQGRTKRIMRNQGQSMKCANKRKQKTQSSNCSLKFNYENLTTHIMQHKMHFASALALKCIFHREIRSDYVRECA